MARRERRKQPEQIPTLERTAPGMDSDQARQIWDALESGDEPGFAPAKPPSPAPSSTATARS